MEVLNNDFFIYALVTSFLLSVISAPVGVFLTLKRMSLMGDAISHSLLPGMAIALIVFGFSTVGLLLGGLLTGLLVLVLMFWITQRSVLKDDSVLALIYLTMSSLGIILLSVSDVKIDLMHFLFGNILLIPVEWIYIIAVSVVLVLIIFKSIYHPLMQIIVDPEYGKFLKISEFKIKNTFYFLVLWVLILSFYSVGTMLALGFLIIPAMVSKLFVRSIKKQILLAVVFGWIISLCGIATSFIWNFPTGPSIILFGGALFILLMPLRKSFGAASVVALMLVFTPHLKATPKTEILYSFPLLAQIGEELLSGLPATAVKAAVLIERGKSVHSYSLLPADIQKLKKANVMFVIGMGFENFNAKDFKKRFPTLKVVTLSEQAPYLKANDPHIWNHPLIAIHMAKKMLEELLVLNPEQAEILNKNYKKYEKELSTLHAKYLNTFKELKKKKIIVAHDSFGYFKVAYKLEIYSPSGFSSHDHSKPADLIKIKEMLRKDPKIPLFKEASANNIFIEHLAKELNLAIAGTLNGESFMDVNKGQFNYISYLSQNLEQIASSLKN